MLIQNGMLASAAAEAEALAAQVAQQLASASATLQNTNKSTSRRKTSRPPAVSLAAPEPSQAPSVSDQRPKEPPKLFPFQRKVINEIYNHIRQNEKRILLVAACGAGKTLISSWIIRDATQKAKNPMRCMFLVKFNCLLDQAAEELRGLGVECSILQGSRKFDNNADVVVASIQTIRSRLKKQSVSEVLGRFGLVMIDESHETCWDKVYAQIEEHFLKTGTVFIGLTATPWRTSRSQYLGQWFDVLVEAPQPPELIKMGRLVPCRIFGFGQVFDFTQLDLGRDGDYRVDQMEEQAIRKASLDLVVKEYRRLASDRTAAAYCVSVEHARLLSEAFNQAGVRSEWLSGATSREERDAINERLSLGVTRVVCSVGTLTTGWNVPSVGCIIMDRATTSKALYCLDLETEVLTPDGFKRWNEVNEGDPVAAFDIKTQEIKWVAALAKVVRPVYESERMVEYSSSFVNFRVTDGHNLIWRPKKSGINDPAWRFSKAGSLAQRTHDATIPVAGFQSSPGVLLSDAELRFLGLWVTDGSIGPTGGITITQSEHQPFHDYIQNVLSDCGFQYKTHKSSGGTVFNETSPRVVYRILRGRIGGKGEDRLKRDPSGVSRLDPYLDKNFSPLLEKMTADQLSVFLEACHVGDGRKSSGLDGRGKPYTQRTYEIGTGNKVFAERLQSLCIRRGFRCNMRIDTGNRINAFYVLMIKKDNKRMIGGVNQKDRASMTVSSPAHGEMVWCLETELGTLVTRRKGKPLIMGNCQIAGRGGRAFPGKHDYLLLDFGNNQRHGNPTSYQEYDIGPKNFRKKQDFEFMKACPECGFMNYNWARICSECDHEFELLKDQEQEEDDDVAPQDVELVERFLGIDRVKLAFLRQQKRECFKHDISPDEAINAFLTEYGHLPPDEWHAQAILGRSPSNKRKKQFEKYLKKHAVHDYWYRRHHKLEFQPAPSGNQQTKGKPASFDSKGGWWQVLEVSRTCTRDEAKQAYKALIRTAHPDVNPQDREGAEARTKLLNAAWEDAKRYFDGA